MRSRSIVAFTLFMAVCLAWAPGSVAAGHGLVVGSEHTTATDFSNATQLDNVTVDGSSDAASVILPDGSYGFEDEPADAGLADGWEETGSGDTQFNVSTDHARSGTQSYYVANLEGASGIAQTQPTQMPLSAPSTQNVSVSIYGSTGGGFEENAIWLRESGTRFVYVSIRDNVLVYRNASGDFKTISSDANAGEWVNLTIYDFDPTANTVDIKWESPDASGIVNDAETASAFSTGYDQAELISNNNQGWFDDVDVGQHDGAYISQTHTASKVEQGWTNLTLENATADVTWVTDTDDDGTFETTVNSTTYSTTGNHTLALDPRYDDWRVNVSFEHQSGATTARLHDDGVLFTSTAPSGSNSKPLDGTKLSSSDVDFKVDVNDSDFGTGQGDTVTATLQTQAPSESSFSDAGQTTTSSNGTVTVTETLSDGGDWKYRWVLTDSYGESVTTSTKTISVPAELRVYNESAPTQLVDNATVELRMYANETGDVQVFERNTTDGTINMSGLPADQPFVVVAEADNYTNRRIFVPSLYETQRIYLLPANEQTADTLFAIDDYTGDYPSDHTVLLVQRSLNGSYQTVLGDYFGATGEFPAQLAYNQRHRLVLYNVKTGDTRRVGTYTPLTSSTQTVVVTPQGVSTVDGEPPSIVLHPQLRRLPALSGADLGVTVREGDFTVSSWNVTATLQNATHSETVWTYSSSIAGSGSTTLDLSGRHNATLVVDVTWNTTDGISATKTYEIAITKTLTNDQSLLQTIGDLAKLSPAGNARAAFTGFLAMLVTVLVIAAIGTIQPSQEIAGLAGILTLTGFAVIDFGVTYDVVFVASVGFLAFTSIRRGL